MDPNEAARPRAKIIREAIEKDEHFYFPIGDKACLTSDLRFMSQRSVPCKDNPACWTFPTLNIELKDFTGEGNSDYLSSILSGHLWGQMLAARELQEPVVVVVLGDDNDVGAAIRKAASHATAGHRVDPKKLMEYFRMVEAFEANAIALGIRVWRLKTDPYARMLLRARKILQGGDLSGFAPSPPEDERQKVGLSILAGKGIGPSKAGAILEHFGVWLVADELDCYLTDCDGIGPKLAEKIGQNIQIANGAVTRPPKPKRGN
jgi:hypothetical protein